MELQTVAEIIGDAPTRGKTEPFRPAVLPGTAQLPPPGIYFGVPEDEYFSWPALSSSGIKDILSSPMLYWARSPWLSEARRDEELEQAAKPDERLHRSIGRAYHCRILEGREEYARRFACELTPEECKGALESTDEIKAAILKAGHKPHAKVTDQMPDGSGAFSRTARKEDWILQLLEIDPKARILSKMREEHRGIHDGKAFIPHDAHAQIEIAAKMIEADPEIRRAFMGGYPEVTLIWYCAETGVPMKARVDYLQIKAAVDLKSIKFEGGMSMERALARAIASYSYNFQPAVYLEGIQAVRRLVAANGGAVCNIESGEPDEDKILSWLEKWGAETPEPKWLFVFQAKGIAPITRACFYPTGGTTHMITCDMVKTAKRRFKKFSETFGVEPWVDVQSIYDLSDEDLPPWATEI